MQISEKTKEFLLNLAFETLEKAFGIRKKLTKPPKEIETELNQKAGVFVSIYINKQLKGCIGNLTLLSSIYKGVIENTLNAAFKDPRFCPLKKSDLKNIKIEISILTPLKKVSKNEIVKNKHGVFLKYGNYSATFLPQVWKHFNSKEDFLFNLALKAGIPPNFIDNPKTEFFVYEAIVFSKKIDEKLSTAYH